MAKTPVKDARRNSNASDSSDGSWTFLTNSEETARMELEHNTSMLPPIENLSKDESSTAYSAKNKSTDNNVIKKDCKITSNLDASTSNKTGNSNIGQKSNKSGNLEAEPEYEQTVQNSDKEESEAESEEHDPQTNIFIGSDDYDEDEDEDYIPEEDENYGQEPEEEFEDDDEDFDDDLSDEENSDDEPQDDHLQVQEQELEDEEDQLGDEEESEAEDSEEHEDDEEYDEEDVEEEYDEEEDIEEEDDGEDVEEEDDGEDVEEEGVEEQVKKEVRYPCEIRIGHRIEKNLENATRNEPIRLCPHMTTDDIDDTPMEPIKLEDVDRLYEEIKASFFEERAMEEKARIELAERRANKRRKLDTASGNDGDNNEDISDHDSNLSNSSTDPLGTQKIYIRPPNFDKMYCKYKQREELKRQQKQLMREREILLIKKRHQLENIVNSVCVGLSKKMERRRLKRKRFEQTKLDLKRRPSSPTSLFHRNLNNNELIGHHHQQRSIKQANKFNILEIMRIILISFFTSLILCLCLTKFGIIDMKLRNNTIFANKLESSILKQESAFKDSIYNGKLIELDTSDELAKLDSKLLDLQDDLQQHQQESQHQIRYQPEKEDNACKCDCYDPYTKALSSDTCNRNLLNLQEQLLLLQDELVRLKRVFKHSSVALEKCTENTKEVVANFIKSLDELDGNNEFSLDRLGSQLIATFNAITPFKFPLLGFVEDNEQDNETANVQFNKKIASALSNLSESGSVWVQSVGEMFVSGTSKWLDEAIKLVAEQIPTNTDIALRPEEKQQEQEKQNQQPQQDLSQRNQILPEPVLTSESVDQQQQQQPIDLQDNSKPELATKRPAPPGHTMYEYDQYEKEAAIRREARYIAHQHKLAKELKEREKKQKKAWKTYNEQKDQLAREPKKPNLQKHHYKHQEFVQSQHNSKKLANQRMPSPADRTTIDDQQTKQKELEAERIQQQIRDFERMYLQEPQKEGEFERYYIPTGDMIEQNWLKYKQQQQQQQQTTM